VVLALGTRLNPFSTLPGYGIDYWPKDAKIIQVDINPDRIGLTKKVSVGIVGDAAKVAEGILAAVRHAGDEGRDARKAPSPDQVALGAAAVLDGPRGRRSPAPPGTSAPARPSPTG
jgi:thiamine pyrophosphate-dependent acetolactate synthase large subunit-like protein